MRRFRKVIGAASVPLMLSLGCVEAPPEATNSTGNNTSTNNTSTNNTSTNNTSTNNTSTNNTSTNNTSTNNTSTNNTSTNNTSRVCDATWIVEGEMSFGDLEVDEKDGVIVYAAKFSSVTGISGTTVQLGMVTANTYSPLPYSLRTGAESLDVAILAADPLQFVVAIRKPFQKNMVEIHDCSEINCATNTLDLGGEVQDVQLLNLDDITLLGVTHVGPLATDKKKFVAYRLNEGFSLGDVEIEVALENADVLVQDVVFGANSEIVLSGAKGGAPFRIVGPQEGSVPQTCGNIALFLKTQGIPGSDDILIAEGRKVGRTNCSTVTPLIESDVHDLHHVMVGNIGVTSVATGGVTGNLNLAFNGGLTGEVEKDRARQYFFTRVAALGEKAVVFAGSANTGLRVIRETPDVLKTCLLPD